jgi:hypothetical protein
MTITPTLTETENKLVCERGHDGPFQITRQPLQRYFVGSATTALMIVCEDTLDEDCDETELECAFYDDHTHRLCGACVEWPDDVQWV